MFRAPFHRHIESGATNMEAALKGARELGMPIIAMTTTLVAVYAPIGFMGGLVGTLFTEFAFALAGAVVVSGVVALTLSPMLSAHTITISNPTSSATARSPAGLISRDDPMANRSPAITNVWPA